MKEKQKRRVAIIFGGKTTEHEVSLNSAVNVLNAIDRRKYDILPVKISRKGRWQLLDGSQSFASVEVLEKSQGTLVFAGDPETKGFFQLGSGEGSGTSDSPLVVPVDVVFPILHGTFGEDGTLQGLMGMADIPCVGAGVLASALGMDKIMMKQIYFQDDLPGVDFLWFLRKNWMASPGVIEKGVREEIGFPCFIKPANSGSSVGVYKAHDEKEFKTFMNQAVEYDRKVLVEKGVDARELECAVLGNDDPQASVVGEIIAGNEFYDYEAKYKSEESRTVIPADIPEEIAEKVKRLAVKAFKAIDCAGMGRVDFLMERGTNRIYVNEINTIPGFTPISMYPKLWEASGIPYPNLIDRLIELALERHGDLKQTKFQMG